MNVSVITPVWDRVDLTMQFLQRNWGLYQSRPEVEFIVIDNGSTDATPQLLSMWKQTMDGRLIIHRNEVNAGFGPAHNQGAGLARGDALVFLSNDVLATGDYVTLIVQSLAEEPGALVGPELLRHDTGWNTFSGQTIAYLAGWCVACKRDTWQLLGGWDERYVPCDYEDIDLSYTARQKGTPLIQVPLPLSHAFGQTIHAHHGNNRHAITMRSRAAFVQKWRLA